MHANQIVGDAESGGDDAGGGRDEPSDVGMAEAHESEVDDAGDERQDVDRHSPQDATLSNNRRRGTPIA